MAYPNEQTSKQTHPFLSTVVEHPEVLVSVSSGGVSHAAMVYALDDTMDDIRRANPRDMQRNANSIADAFIERLAFWSDHLETKKEL